MSPEVVELAAPLHEANKLTKSTIVRTRCGLEKRRKSWIDVSGKPTKGMLAKGAVKPYALRIKACTRLRELADMSEDCACGSGVPLVKDTRREAEGFAASH